jgi:SAM-dependent methyltransferase
MIWDERYSQAEYVYGKEPNNFLAQHFSRMPKGAVLCLADGEGRNGVFLAQQGYAVTSVDASRAGLAKAAKLAAERGVPLRTVHADLAEFTIAPGSWDGIVSIFCHLAPAIRTRLHREVVKGLKPGGVLVLEAYTPAQIALGTGGPPVPELTMTLDGLREELAGLDFELGRELERDVIEGKYHTGRGAVVQVIARKPARHS